MFLLFIPFHPYDAYAGMIHGNEAPYLISLVGGLTLLQVLFREACAKHWKDLDGATRLACEELALEDQVGIEIFSETNRVG